MHASLPRRAVALAALLLAAALAGCADDERAPPEVVEALAGTTAMTWAPGNHWDYAATFHENQTFHVALVVHEHGADGFRLGSNVSAGFFGLPFNGNVSRELNPRIGAEEWPMFRFPLEDGKSWSYTLFGYDATTTARAALVDVPGLGKVPGFRMEAKAYGQLFARYTYVPDVGWFTSLELIEPTDGHHVLDVRLTGYGVDFGSGYYVERTLRSVHLDYPGTAVGPVDVRVPDGYVRVNVLLVAESTAGVVDATVKDGRGATWASARATGKGAATDRASAPATAGTLTLEHAGLGKGRLHLEVTGLTAAGGVPRATSQEDPPAVDLAALLQSTRPARPQEGHATSTGSPVAV